MFPQGEPPFVPFPFFFRDGPKTALPRSRLGFNLSKGWRTVPFHVKQVAQGPVPARAAEGHRGNTSGEACECARPRMCQCLGLPVYSQATSAARTPCSNLGYRE